MKELLIVDDEMSVLRFLSAFLKSDQYCLKCASSVDECIDLISEEVKLIVTDYKMHQRLGTEIVDYTLENKLDCEVIMITGFDDVQISNDVRNRCLDVIQKPFEIDEFRNLVMKVMEEV